MSIANSLCSIRCVSPTPHESSLVTAMQKYYLVVFLVEVFSVEFVVDKLRKGKYKSREDILATSESNPSLSIVVTHSLTLSASETIHRAG